MPAEKLIAKLKTEKVILSRMFATLGRHSSRVERQSRKVDKLVVEAMRRGIAV